MSVVTAPVVNPFAVQRTKGTAVHVEGVSKRFSVRRSVRETLLKPLDWKYASALQDVNCAVREGEFFGLLGPNGAGKTTLFKILATLVTPDHGRATILGLDLVRDADAVRRVLVPVVADERSLRWRLSARDNLRLYADLYKTPRKGVSNSVDELLQLVGLADTGTKMVGQFSSGMRQRLQIARALLARPRILLLDEPTRGLDPVSARTLRAFLREDLCERHGCTVLLATHNTEEAFDLCDRVGILDGGRLLVTGPANALATEYGEPIYRMWTNDPDHPALATLVLRDLVQDVSTHRPDASGWASLDLKIPGGLEQASHVIQFLASQQVSLARFERVGLSLAELIERVQKQAREDGHA